MTRPFWTSTLAGGCANLHSLSEREHLLRWNSRHTSSCSHRESFTLSMLFRLTFTTAMFGCVQLSTTPIGSTFVDFCGFVLSGLCRLSSFRRLVAWPCILRLPAATNATVSQTTVAVSNGPGFGEGRFLFLRVSSVFGSCVIHKPTHRVPSVVQFASRQSVSDTQTRTHRHAEGGQWQGNIS